ncbi:MAG: large-conductance mechanosensitive channel protein MscL [Flavobacteriales bacterium]|nr:large-conductance mechanosensitive channel protein MscL [Flavobacteriales bacterium]
MGLIKEFKKFISRGNVMDMAVGVVIGGAFGKIVNSLVADIIMPLIGLITGGVDFTDQKWVLRAGDAAENIPELSIGYGQFIQVIIQFLIIAFAIFLLLKVVNKIMDAKKEEPKPTTPPAPSAEEKLLGEILEELKKKN